MGRIRWLTWGVPAAGVLVLAGSLGPWWVLRLAPGGSLITDYGTGIDSFSAWQAPNRWAYAVGLSLAGAFTWTGWRLRGGRVPGLICLLLAVSGLIAVGIAVHEWQVIPPVSRLYADEEPAEVVGVAVTTIGSGDPFGHVGMEPGQLYREDSPLSTQGPGWGLHVGLGGMALVAALLSIDAARRRPRAGIAVLVLAGGLFVAFRPDRGEQDAPVVQPSASSGRWQAYPGAFNRSGRGHRGHRRADPAG